MKILKKNQIIISVLALMLITAGYLNSTSKTTGTSISTNTEGTDIAGIGDAKLVSNSDVIAGKNEINNLIENSVATNENIEETSAKIDNNKVESKDDYFQTSRLGRDTMYSQMIESYQKILENSNISQEQKSIATQEISKINQTKNAIMISENLIKTKEFEDVVIFANDKSINVIVKAEKIEQDKIAQIQNIISREMKADIDNIHISNK